VQSGVSLDHLEAREIWRNYVFLVRYSGFSRVIKESTRNYTEETANMRARLDTCSLGSQYDTDPDAHQPEWQQMRIR
jgi:hypothetical protein